MAPWEDKKPVQATAKPEQKQKDSLAMIATRDFGFYCPELKMVKDGEAFVAPSKEAADKMVENSQARFA